MTKISVYDYKSYKKFIVDWMDLLPAHGRGQRKLLAGAIGCQTPFVTQVLNGDYHFSLEQSEACARWLGLGVAETDFFLLLVLKQRAGTKSLATVLDRQLDERREKDTQLNQRLKISDSLTGEDQVIYYSSWQYPAVHIALLQPELRTIEELHRYFALPLPRLVAVLDFLTAKKLVRARGGRYEVLKPVLHLGRDSPLLPKHHANWRLKAIEAAERGDQGDFRYTGVISISKDDFEWVKGQLSNMLESVIERVKDSPDERLGCLALDLFGI